MPDIGGFPALDVAIGLLFVYVVFSLITSGINELLVSMLGLRARYLEQGLRSMLVDPDGAPDEADEFLEAFAKHPLVNSLVKNPNPSGRKPWQRRLPSYMPSRTFALTMLDTFAPPPTVDPDEDADGQDVLARVRSQLADADVGSTASLPTQAQTAVLGMLNRAEASRDELRQELENWFDDTMDRVSGWYKRRVTLILLVISLIVAGGLNVDSFAIANKLLNDETIRTAVVAQAQRATERTTQDQAEEVLDTAGQNVKDLQALQLPIGWIPEQKDRPEDVEPDPREWRGFESLTLGKLAGILVTALALSLGAPFWFDLLSKIMRLRGSGIPEGGPRDRRPRRERPETAAPTRRGGAPGAPRPAGAGAGELGDTDLEDDV